MKTSVNKKVNELRRPEISTTSTRTLDEVVVEIQEIVTETDCVETSLAELKSNGYQYEHCWIKNGGIGTIWYMKRKKVLRIQVSESELFGEYYKAYCVIVPITDIVIQESDSSRVRNFPIKQYPEFGKTSKSGNITENIK